MKKILTFVLPALAALYIAGCDDTNDQIFVEDAIPAAPQNVFSVTGDGYVDLYWNGPYESDIVEYVIYRSTESQTGYHEIGSVPAENNPNLDLLQYAFTDHNIANGQTRFYAVTAVDEAGQESDLSAEEVYDTPRPEGTDDLWSLYSQPALSGYILSTRQKVSYTSPLADIVIDTLDGVFWLNANNDSTDIQDMGYTSDFTNISYAPADGWSQTGYLELVRYHTYVIWTKDFHYAKIRILSTDLATGRITFQWAYQTSLSDLGNQELSPAQPKEKPAHGADYLRRPVTSAVEAR